MDVAQDSYRGQASVNGEKFIHGVWKQGSGEKLWVIAD